MLPATSTVTPPYDTASLAAMEWGLQVLEDAGIPRAKAARAIMTINHYVQGRARAAPGESTAATDDRGHAWWELLSGTHHSAVPPVHQLISREPPTRERAWFAEGLDLILDGIRA